MINYTNTILLQLFLIHKFPCNHQSLQGEFSNLHNHFSCIHQNPTIHRNKTYLLNQWIDLMYLITVDLPESLISKYRTSSYSYFQFSMALPTCTHPIHCQPTYASVCTHPNTLSAHICLRKQGFLVFVVILKISQSTLRATSYFRNFRCINEHL